MPSSKDHSGDPRTEFSQPSLLTLSFYAPPVYFILREWNDFLEIVFGTVSCRKFSSFSSFFVS
jgi:hypothetical protein